ncbi:MAG: hypothetical protein R3195_16520 [Gemmatimonadota bacterium]|nr:hypothetical protein [Gemmatimonadota bacterium]
MNALKRPLVPLMWLAAIVAAEILGRRSPSDVWDALGVCVFSALIAITIARVTRTHSPWALGLRRRAGSIGRRVVSWWPEMGLDFRGEPPVPRGFPGSLLACTVAIGTIAGVGWSARLLLPGPARAAAIGVSPTIYLLALSGLWAALLLAIGTAAFSCWRDLDDHLRNGGLSSGRRGGIYVAAGLAWIGLVAGLAFLVPLAYAWIACLVVAVAGWAMGSAIDRHDALRVIWRPARSRVGDERPVRVFRAGAAIRWDHTSMALLLAALTIPATGIGWEGRLAGTTPVTIGLGSAAVWAGALALISYAAHGAGRLLALARLDPAIREPIPLLLDREPTPHASARLRHHGFRCLAPGDPELAGRGPRCAVGPAIHVTVDAARPARRLCPTAPSPRSVAEPAVEVGAASMGSLSTLADLRRLDTSVLRACLMQGLLDLLERASRQRFDSGTGFWLVPHLWYARGLTRDSDDPDYYSIGPAYHRVIPRRARQHLHAVLGALDVDLVFAEDGARIEGVRDVFERVFDVYDVLGPGRIDERQFVGIPYVRVFLHDFALGEPLRRSGYPEPDYDEIGRARILHIMIERDGGDDVPDHVDERPDRRRGLIPL